MKVLKIILFIACLLLPLDGLRRLQVDTTNRNLRSTDRVESHLGFTSGHTVAFQVMSGAGGQELKDRLLTLESEVLKLPGVKSVWNPAKIKSLHAGRFGLVEGDWLPLETKSVEGDPFEGILYDSDRSWWILPVELSKNWEGLNPIQLRKGLEDLGNPLGPFQARVSGLALAKLEIADLSSRDQSVIAPLVSLLMLVICWSVLGGWRLALPVSFIGGLSLAWTMACVGWLRCPLTPVSALLPPTILVSSTTCGMHLMWSLRDFSGSWSSALKAKWFPCLMSAITTAAGFLCLSISSIPAIRDFGLFAGMGSLLSFLLTFILLPKLKFTWIEKKSEHRNSSVWAAFSERIISNRILIIFVFSLLGILSFAGIPRLTSDTNLLSFLPPESKTLKNADKMSSTLGWMLPLESTLTYLGKEKASLEETMTLLRLLQKQSEIVTSGMSLSVAKIVDHLHRLTVGKKEVPEGADLEEALELLREGHLAQKFFDAYLSRWRLLLGINAGGSEKVLSLEAQLKKNLPPGWKLEFSGDLHEMAMDSDQLVKGQSLSLLLALISATICLALVFRSSRLLLIAWFPNLLPLGVVAGCMGWLEVPLNTGSVLIFSAGLGLIVDNTIHYLHKFTQACREGLSPQEATHLSTIELAPIHFATSMVLCGGFLVSLCGKFAPTREFGMTITFLLLIGLACDLILLPALALTFGKKISDS